MKILVTGGLGYIGSHTIFVEVVDKIKTITGKDFKFIKGDVRDKDVLEPKFKEDKFDSVIHFARLEDTTLRSANPYGSTKLFIEYILDDLCKSDNKGNIVKLRHYNPYISKVAVRELDCLNIFDNYDTKDDTGIGYSVLELVERYIEKNKWVII